MKVYLSGRMSGLPTHIWKRRFLLRKYDIEAKHGNVEVLNPADTMIASHPLLYRIVGYRLTLWYDLQLLKRCDCITMVGDDWMQSRGARLERMKAREWGIQLLE